MPTLKIFRLPCRKEGRTLWLLIVGKIEDGDKIEIRIIIISVIIVIMIVIISYFT